MKITRETLIKIIKEEYAATITTEGIQSDGLRELIADFVAQEVSGWQTVAKASLHKEVAESGFDISDIVMNSLGGGMQEGIQDRIAKFNKKQETEKDEKLKKLQAIDKKNKEKYGKKDEGTLAQRKSEEKQETEKYPERGSQEEAQYEVMVQMGRFLGKLLNQGYDELADEFSQILTQADEAGMRGRKGW